MYETIIFKECSIQMILILPKNLIISEKDFQNNNFIKSFEGEDNMKVSIVYFNNKNKNLLLYNILIIL